MKQTVEVAIEYAGSVISSFGTNGVPNGISAIKEMIASGFKSGAEWRSKQSPWIKISDGLPDVDDYYLVTDGESISMAYFFKGWSKFAKYHKYPHPFYDKMDVFINRLFNENNHIRYLKDIGYHKIGSIFKYNTGMEKIELEVIEIDDSSCDGCVFNNRGYYCMYSCCCNIDREDNTDVIYKEVKRS